MITDRKQIIMGILEERSAVTVVDLSKMLKLSEVTVRKILDEMEADGQLKRTWGGAVSLSGSQKELEHHQKAVKHIREKQAIAEKAYSYINDGDVVFLDSGSTNLELAKLIASGEKKELIVGTNAINIAYRLANIPGIAVVVIGGDLRGNALSCVGPMAENALKRTFYDKGFISAYHCTPERGITTPNAYESQFKCCLMEVCKERFTLVDHSKFGDDSMMLICGLSELDCIITDWQLDQEMLQRVRELNENVIVVPEPGCKKLAEDLSMT